MDLLKIVNINKSYGSHTALKDVNLAIPRQSIFGLLGPNGAGKTSLIRIITQIFLPDSGQIFFNGEPLRPDHITKMGYLPEERGLYKKMRVKEHLLYLARLKSVPTSRAKEKIDHYLNTFELKKWENKSIEDLSKGMQQKVQFIATILHEPELIILDEPFSGFDPVNANFVKKEILKLKENGSTIIYSTHRMETVEEICDSLALINHSKKILEGSIGDIINSFKQNLFIIEGKGQLKDTSDKYKIISIEKSLNDFFSAKISIKEGYTSNDLLREVMGQVQIVTFKEELPTINDIFIAKVKEKK